MTERRETRQKKAIELAVHKTNKFFTAEEIHDKLRKDNPTLGMATVYRFLKELQKERVVHTYVCDRKSLYSKKEMNHSHFVCEECGLKKHIAINKFDFLKKFFADDICHVQIEVSGVCSECKKNKSN